MAFTLTLKPEVEQRLRAAAEAEHRSVHKTVELAVQAYLDGGERREELLRLLRRDEAENEDFYHALGDR
jgi:predicted transcriptional regulator